MTGGNIYVLLSLVLSVSSRGIQLKVVDYVQSRGLLCTKQRIAMYKAGDCYVQSRDCYLHAKYSTTMAR